MVRHPGSRPGREERALARAGRRHRLLHESTRPDRSARDSSGRLRGRRSFALVLPGSRMEAAARADQERGKIMAALISTQGGKPSPR